MSRSSIPHKRALSHGYVIDGSARLLEKGQVDETLSGGGIEPSPKRHRGPEWPLKNDISHPIVHTSRVASRTVSNKKPPPSPGPRPSKFLEGSLNDKPSSRPPASFIGDENLIEEYLEGHEPGSRTDTMEVDAESDKQRSSIFRFGRLSKALSHAFNPSAVWHGLNGIWKDRPEPIDAGKNDLLEARKARAAAAYAELKKAGFQGIKCSTETASSQLNSKHNSRDLANSQRNSFRDSGIDVDEVDLSNIVMLQSKEPAAAQGARPERLVPDSDTVGDQSQVPDNGQTNEGSTALQIAAEAQRVSKKDMAKQQKLSKKVSDLETKLERARRELVTSMQRAPPVPDLPSRINRKPPAPSRLPTLPSERLLAVEPTPDDEPHRRSSRRIASMPSCNDPALSQHYGPQDDTTTSPSTQLQDEFKSSIRHRGAISSATTTSSENWLTYPESQQITGSLIAAAEASQHKRQTSRSQSSIRSVSANASTTSRSKERDLKAPSNSLKTSSPEKTDNSEAPSVPIVQVPSTKRRSSTQYLGRPGAVSPASKTRSRSGAHKSGTSPPPPSLASAKKRRVTFLLDPETPEKKVVHRVRKASSLHGAPLEGSRKANLLPSNHNDPAALARSSLDKPLPDIQREDYQWDEDVF